MPSHATYSGQILVTLHVHVVTGETFEAIPTDYEKFDLVSCSDAYEDFRRAFAEAMAAAGIDDITDSHLNPVRYLLERTIAFGTIAAKDRDYLADTDAEVAELERQLQHRSQGPS